MENKVIQNPLVSIIITTYNRSKTIDQAIQSSLDQDYENIEIVVSDNASTDDTDVIMAKYQNNSKVKYFKGTENIGAIPNYKKATCEIAKGDYVVYVSSDDYLVYNSFISKAVQLISRFENVVIVKGYETQYNESTNQKTNSIDNYKYAKEFYTGEEMFWLFSEIKMGWGGIMIKRDTITQNNMFDNCCFSFDFEINLCLFLTGNVAILNETVYLFRIHPSQDSSSINVEKSIDNFHFADKAYASALNKGFNKQKLDLWKLKIFSGWALIYMYSLYFKNPGTYQKFINLLHQNHPEIYQHAVQNKKWKLFKLIMNLSWISFPVLKIIAPARYRYYQSLKANS